MTPATDIMSLAREERTDLAELLATLTADQWQAPTLCEQWRVRDLVAHIYSYETLGWGRLAVRMLVARAGPPSPRRCGYRCRCRQVDGRPTCRVADQQRQVPPVGFEPTLRR